MSSAHSLAGAIKWPGIGADGGVLRAWWLTVDIVGRPGRAGPFLAQHGGGQPLRHRKARPPDHDGVRVPPGPAEQGAQRERPGGALSLKAEVAAAMSVALGRDNRPKGAAVPRVESRRSGP